jgi:hypothetical protein
VCEALGSISGNTHKKTKQNKISSLTKENKGDDVDKNQKTKIIEIIQIK